MFSAGTAGKSRAVMPGISVDLPLHEPARGQRCDGGGTGQRRAGRTPDASGTTPTRRRAGSRRARALAAACAVEVDDRRLQLLGHARRAAPHALEPGLLVGRPRRRYRRARGRSGQRLLLVVQALQQRSVGAVHRRERPPLVDDEGRRRARCRRPMSAGRRWRAGHPAPPLRARPPPDPASCPNTPSRTPAIRTRTRVLSSSTPPATLVCPPVPSIISNRMIS